jgi:E3 ubiquitin ligase SMURF1/2
LKILDQKSLKILTFGTKKLIVCGLETLELSTWKENTVYKNCTVNTTQVKWFWRAVESFDNEKRVRLLQLVTGSTRLPIKEFGRWESENDNLSPFTVCLLQPSAGVNALPVIHAWFDIFLILYLKLLTI